VRENHFEITFFTEFHSKVNETNKFGMSPLHHGTVAGNAEVVQILLENGGDANLVNSI